MFAQIQQKFRRGTGGGPSALYPPVTQKLYVARGFCIGIHHFRGPCNGEAVVWGRKHKNR